jgi:hypothetical protein
MSSILARNFFGLLIELAKKCYVASDSSHHKIKNNYCGQIIIFLKEWSINLYTYILEN